MRTLKSLRSSIVSILGKLVTDAATIDAPGSAHFFQWYAEAIDKIYDEVAPTGPGDLALVRRVPLGVVGAVTPWNFPLDMATWKAAAALAAGNSVVLKPAEQSPLSALRLAELAAEAGVPDGVFNVVPGYGHTAGKALGLHMDVDCLAFTGSTAIGKMFMQYSGQSNLKQVWPETGGKSPNIVFADCDNLDAAADMAAFGIFFNQGEVCSANSRLYIERSIKDEFMAKLIQRAEAMQPGDPLDPASRMGAIVDEKQTQGILGFIENGKNSANLVTGGNRVLVEGKAVSFSRPSLTMSRRTMRWRGMKSLGRFFRSSPLTAKMTPCAWPTIPFTASRPLSGQTTSAAHVGWQTACMSARFR